jgi:hypothetical protein
LKKSLAGVPIALQIGNKGQVCGLNAECNKRKFRVPEELKKFR